MRIRHPLARPDVASLEPLFKRIRADSGIEEGYTPEVYFEAEQASDGETAETDPPHIVGERIDATDLPLVTIDPEGSRDLDQALYIEPVGSGHWVYYAIADVAAFVTPGGALDRDTRHRGVTIYCPDRRVSLHPPILSEGRASLLAGQRTKAVLWTLSLDETGNLGEIDVRRAWVRSTRQYSFDELADSPPEEAATLLASLRLVGDRRRALSRSRGAVTMPRPSQEIRTEDGRMTLEFRVGTPIEDDNAQISLMTGEAAARLMLDGGVGILRTLPPADERAVQRLRHQARALGIAWEEGVSYGDLLESLDPAEPGTAAFLAEATSLFRGARWIPFDDTNPDLPRPDALTHGALAVPYAHVTAPIRRLVDRFAAEACLAIATGRSVPIWVREALADVGKSMATADHTSRKVERSCIDAVEAAILADHVGEEFLGVGIDSDTVQLAKPAIVARCRGDIQEGEEQRVRLVSARPEEGPVFTVV